MQSQENKSNKNSRVLCVYAATQTYTSTVFEHLDAFRKYSQHAWSFLDYSKLDDSTLNFSDFDTVVIHYSVRLPFDQISPYGIEKLNSFGGLKVLFIQDEYDHTNATKNIIRLAGFNLVFSVVPTHSLPRVYPHEEFPGVRFVSNFTGYVPDDLAAQIGVLPPPSRRSVLIAYRGRPLPARYGRLGLEKVDIGRGVNCERLNRVAQIHGAGVVHPQRERGVPSRGNQRVGRQRRLTQSGNRAAVISDGCVAGVGVRAGERPGAGAGLGDGDCPVAVGDISGNGAARAAGAEDKGLGARRAGRDGTEGHGVGAVMVFDYSC